MKKNTMDNGKKTHLFWKYPPRVREKLRIDEVGFYSVTPSKFSRQISRIMLDFVSRDATIVDATACVGGDTATLADTFKRVIAIEKHRKRYEMLCHNLPLMTDKKVETFYGDFLTWCRNHKGESVDLFYIDPPWEDECRMGDSSLWQVCAMLKRDFPLTTIVLKLPPTFHVKLRHRSLTMLRNWRGESKIKVTVM